MFLKKVEEWEKEEEEEDKPQFETDEEIDDSLKINFQEMIGEDSDGQMSMVVPEKMQLERQITGQMSIAEVLEEWEKTKKAAEEALEIAKQRKLESAKAKALQEAGDIMDRLTDVIPKLDAGISPRELLQQQYLKRNLSRKRKRNPWKQCPLRSRLRRLILQNLQNSRIRMNSGS